MRTVTIEAVWQMIEALSGERFTQKRGAIFTYRVVGGQVVPDRTSHNIPRSHFEKALERWPVDGPGDLNDLRGPSYIYAVLADPRVARARTE